MNEKQDLREQPFEGKRLFEVEISQTIFVLAQDESEAKEIAAEQASCGGNLEWTDAQCFAHKATGLPKDWRDAIPFGANNDETCEQVAEAWEEYERARPMTQAELEAAGQMRLA